MISVTVSGQRGEGVSTIALLIARVLRESGQMVKLEANRNVVERYEHTTAMELISHHLTHAVSVRVCDVSVDDVNKVVDELTEYHSAEAVKHHIAERISAILAAQEQANRYLETIADNTTFMRCK